MPSPGFARRPGWVTGTRTNCGTPVLAQGTPLHVVSEVLGHASIAITKDVYGHLVEGDKRAAAESMTGVLFGGQPQGRGSQRDSQSHKKGPSADPEGLVTWRARRDSNPQPSDP